MLYDATMVHTPAGTYYYWDYQIYSWCPTVGSWQMGRQIKSVKPVVGGFHIEFETLHMPKPFHKMVLEMSKAVGHNIFPLVDTNAHQIPGERHGQIYEWYIKGEVYDGDPADIPIIAYNVDKLTLEYRVTWGDTEFSFIAAQAGSDQFQKLFTNFFDGKLHMPAIIALAKVCAF